MPAPPLDQKDISIRRDQGLRFHLPLVCCLLGTLAGCAGAMRGTAAAPGQPSVPGQVGRDHRAISSSETATGTRGVAIGVRETLTSKVLHEDRELLVYTPPSYGTSERAFPVLYLLDGEVHFHHVTGVVEFLASSGRILPMIVVGIVNTDRSRDFTPSYEEDVANSGGANKFERFIETELIPRIDQRYRTLPYRILVGHSFGGLLAMHILVERPELFDAYIAISPSLDWDRELIQRRAKKRWKGDQPLDKFLYFTLGTEPKAITRGNRDFATFLQASAPPGLTWSFEMMTHDDHGSTPHKSVYSGLEKLFADWRLPAGMEEPAAIAAHYQAVSKRFHISAKAPENALNLLGYRLLAADKNQQAIEIFRMAVAAYPTSPNVYDSLGEALEKVGDHKQALVNYERAVEYATQQGHPQLEIFQRNRDRLR